MTLKFKILAISTLLVSLFFLGGEIFVDDFYNNANTGILAFVSMVFLIIFLIVYHFDKENNKKSLEKYNKENNVKGEDILDAIRVKYQDQFPILKKRTKKESFSFSKLSPLKKVLIIVYILSFIFATYFGFMNLVKQELNKPTEEEMYRKMNVSEEVINYIKENK